MGEVVEFKKIEEITASADAALLKSMGMLTDVVILGVTKGGYEFFGSSDDLGMADILWRLERARAVLMEQVDD